MASNDSVHTLSSYSASRLARTDAHFDAWLRGTPIRGPLEEVSGPHDTTLNDLNTQTSVLPAWITDERSRYFEKTKVTWSPRYELLLDTLIRSASTKDGVNTTTSYSDADSDALSLSLPKILYACKTLQDLRDSSLSANEATLRSPVDELTRYIFRCVPVGEPLEFRTEVIISLPYSNYNDVPIDTTAVVDTVAIFHRNEVFPVIATIEVIRQASFMDATTLHLDIPQWFSEYKRIVPNANQLCYDLGAAQLQRRALGYTDQLVFGAECTGGNLRVHSAWWTTSSDGGAARSTLPSSGTPQVIIIKPLLTLDLKIPLNCVRFFLLLRGIMRNGDGLAAQFNRLDETSIIKAQKTLSPWRRLKPNASGSKKRKHSQIDEDVDPSEQAPRDAGGGSLTAEDVEPGQQGPEDAAGCSLTDEDTIWSEKETRILEWKRECFFHLDEKGHKTTAQEANLSDFSALMA